MEEQFMQGQFKNVVNEKIVSPFFFFKQHQIISTAQNKIYSDQGSYKGEAALHGTHHFALTHGQELSHLKILGWAKQFPSMCIALHYAHVYIIV